MGVTSAKIEESGYSGWTEALDAEFADMDANDDRAVDFAEFVHWFNAMLAAQQRKHGLGAAAVALPRKDSADASVIIDHLTFGREYMAASAPVEMDAGVINLCNTHIGNKGGLRCYLRMVNADPACERLVMRNCHLHDGYMRFGLYDSPGATITNNRFERSFPMYLPSSDTCMQLYSCAVWTGCDLPYFRLVQQN